MATTKNRKSEKRFNKIKQYLVFRYLEDGSFCIIDCLTTKKEAESVLETLDGDCEVIKVMSKKPIKGKMNTDETS